MSLYTMLGPMMNDWAYGKGSANNPNPQGANRQMGQVVSPTITGANKGVNPAIPQAANGGGGMTPTPGTPAPTAGTQTPENTPGSGSYNFSQSPLQNGFNYLGQQFGNLTAGKPNSQTQTPNVIGKNAGGAAGTPGGGTGVPGDMSAASPEKKAAQSGMY